jgi:hypothetical protein
MNNHVLYVTECDHVNFSAPTLIQKGHIWCGPCSQEQKVTGVHVFEWHMSCMVCNYARWTGTSRHLADQLAKSHERGTMHKCKVEYDRNPKSMVELDRLRKARAI